MSKRKEMDYIKDMLEAAGKAAIYCKDLNYEEFSNDIKTQDAVIRNIEILGEAAKKVSKNIRDIYPEIPWKNITGMRDKLIHDYFGVNIDIVWDVIKNDFPGLIDRITIILDIK
jgi:uncharacterized protein with HEPN domain